MPSVRSSFLQVSLRSALSLALLSSLACSKETDTQKTKEASVPSETSHALFQNSLLNQLPKDSLAVLMYDKAGEPAKKFERTKWAALSSNEQVLQALESNPNEPLVKIAKSLVESDLDLFTTTPNKRSYIQRSLWFAAGLPRSQTNKEETSIPNDLPRIGFLAEGTKDSDLTQRLEILRAKLTEKGFTPQDISLPTGKGFTIKIPFVAAPENTTDGNGNLPLAVPGKPIVENLYFGATSAYFAGVSTENALKEVLTFDNKKSGITDRKNYQLGVAQVARQQESLGFLFVDVEKALQEAKEKGLLKPPSDSSTEASKNEGYSNEEEALRSLENQPLKALFATREMGQDLSDEISVLVDPHTEGQKRFFAALEKAQSLNFLDKISQQLVFFLGLDGALLKAARDSALQETPEDQKASLTQFTKVVDLVEGIGLAIKNAAPGSPFPDVLFYLPSTKTVEAKAALSELLSMGVAAGGMTKWQEKQISGVPVKFAVSPFGVGVYLADANGVVLIGSSEAAVMDGITSTKGGHPAIATIPSGIKAPISYHLDLVNLASLLEGVQSTLSMFTGGKTTISAEQLEKLKKSGRTTGYVSYSPGALKVVQQYQ